MGNINETKVTGRAHRVWDAANDIWKRVSYWTKASDVEFDDGETAEEKVNDKNNLKLFTDPSKDIRFGIDGNGDYGYIKPGENVVNPFRSRHDETYKPTVRANNNDMGLYHKKRYVDTTAVPNLNTETYTFPVNDTGGTKDLGATNNYRYTNAQNVYNKGVADDRTWVSTWVRNSVARYNSGVAGWGNINSQTDANSYVDVAYNAGYNNRPSYVVPLYENNGYTTYNSVSTAVIDTWNNASKHFQAFVYCENDQNNSTTGNFYVEGSNDGTNWEALQSTSISLGARVAGQSRTLTGDSGYRFFRFREQCDRAWLFTQQTGYLLVY